MPNQMIALQARAPNVDPLGGAIRNNAAMINMVAQQQAAQRQNAIAEQTMQIQRAKEARETAMAGPQLEKAQSEAGAARMDLVTKAVGHALHTSVNNPTDETLDQAAATLAGIGLNPAEIDREIMPIKQLPLDQRKGALMQSILSDPNSKAAFEATLPKPKEMRLGDRTILIDENPLSSTFNQPIRTEMVGMTPAQANPTGKVVQDASGNYFTVDPRTGTAKPVTMGGGGGGGIPGARGGAVDPNAFKAAIVQKESGGDYTALSPKGALGAFQVMPATAKTLAGRLGLPWNPDLMRSNTPQGRQYQDAIGNAAVQEAWQAGGGDVGRAAAYYHGGSDESQWKGKTQAYARDIVASLGNGAPAPAAGGGQLQGPVKGAKPATAAANAKTTQQEQTASYNINRVLQAAAEIQRVTKNNPSANAPGALEATVGSLPLISQGVNFTRSSDRQIVAAAQRDLLDGLLYLATGAAYNKEQLQGQLESYIPSYSDAPATVTSKRARLAALVASAKTRAGRAWTPQMDASLNALISGGGGGAATQKPNAASGGWGKAEVVGN